MHGRTVRRLDPLLLLRLTALGLMLVVLTRTQADPDLWGHVQFGRDIVLQRSIPSRDTYYSFTSDLPWLNHEWLSEAAIYFSYALLGPSGLAVLKLVLVLATIAVVLRTLAAENMPASVHDAVVFLTIAGIAPLSTHIRPEMFSLFLLAVLLALLRGAEHRVTWSLAFVPVQMLVWANLHGGWLVGIGTLGVWIATETFTRGRSLRARLALLAIGAISLAATLVNPYGVRSWTFLRETVSLERRDIVEWLPVYQLGPGMIVLWLLITTVAFAAIVFSQKRPRVSAAAVVAMLGFASFRVGRLIGFFAISTVMFLAPQVAGAWNRRGQKGDGRTIRPASRIASSMVIAASAVALAVSAVSIYNNLRCVRMEDDWSPEPGAARFINANGLHGRMLTWFNWGDYAIWHFSPRILVSMDGRREAVYSDRVRERHLAFFFNAAGSRGYASEIKADYIWLPKNLPIVAVLLKSPGWTLVFEGSRSVLFAPRGTELSVRNTSDTQVIQTRCFPGP